MNDETNRVVEILDWAKSYWEILAAAAFGVWTMAKAIKFHFFDRISALEQLSGTMATKEEVTACRRDMVDLIETKIDKIGDKIITKMDSGFKTVHNRIDAHLERRSSERPFEGRDMRRDDK